MGLETAKTVNELSAEYAWWSCGRFQPLTPDPAAALQLDLDERHLILTDVPNAFALTTVRRINPKQNTKLMGVYTSSTGFFSLCEAEGFRRITPFPDRPDVMAKYTVTLHADKARYPVA